MPRSAAIVICCWVAGGCMPTRADHLVDVSVTTPCVTCHLKDFPPDHLATGKPTTCEDCHHSMTSWGAAAPSGNARDPAHDLTITALIPSYSGTSIAQLTALAEVLPMNMSHTSPDVGATTLGNCSACHSGSAAGTYFPGVFHASLTALGVAQPTSCSSCHADSTPTGFVGPPATDPARTPASGEMVHDAVLWSQGAPTSTAVVTEDCGTCHHSQTAWNDGVYHAALTGAGQAQPGSCLDCHANTRPAAVLASTNAALPAGVKLDHTIAETLGDCVSCHTDTASWSGGRYHLAASATPTTCLPCHADERPTTTAQWTSTSYTSAPFDYVTNANGVTHGDGQDCVLCHDGPGAGGAWGGSQTWRGGSFAHGATTIAGTTCLACHLSQRPTQPVDSFNHATDGSGDCFGCHQATVTADRYAAYPGDWQGGQSYPGSTLVSSGTGALTPTEWTLTRSGAGGLITGMTSITATLTSGMLHTASVIPAAVNPGPAGQPDNTKCWHCHQSSGTTVTAFADGQFHAKLDSYSAVPGGAITPLPQPTSGCAECHGQVRPTGIVERAASPLQPMDHAGSFAAPSSIGGVTASSVLDLDCSVCHRKTSGIWDDGQFHANIGAAVPADCTACHYPLMATAAADTSSGVEFAMKHRSTQITFQSCQTCHASALGSATGTPIAAALWSPGAYHASLAAQPDACLDCHAGSDPNGATQSAVGYAFALGGTSSNGPQWMSHASTYVSGKDCAACHAADARPTGAVWGKTTSFHAAVSSVTACQGCHGLQNGNGSTPGTNNNLPATPTNSSTMTTAAADPTTGVPAGTFDQISHTDLNVGSHDCGFCHTQVGAATAPPAQGKEWAQAKFHASFVTAPPVMNGSTGRCSNCHLNLKPGPSFTFDHSGFTATSMQDCSSCHVYPGTGTPSAPNWLGAAGAPATITVGGFTIPEPPAASPTVQAGIANLPHPAVTGTCTDCHTSAGGGRPAIGYDHLSTLIVTSCNACHEAGTDLLGTVWNGATTSATGAGDSRPFTLPFVTANRGGDSSRETYPDHFYPADCGLCHPKPAGNGTVTTGTAYTSAWTFNHPNENQSCASWCMMCHTSGCPD